MTTPLRPAKLLIVDDETVIGLTMKRLLRKHAVDVASSGSIALELLQKSPDYDLVFCDLMMPAMSGMDLFGRVERDLPALADRFVFMTGGAFTREAVDFLDHVGQGRVIHKPLQFRNVLTLVEDTLAARA